VGLTGELDQVEVMVEKDEKEPKDNLLKTLIEDLKLSVRSYNCLRRTGICTLEDLTRNTEDDMIKMRNLGNKSLVEVTLKLKELGLSFRVEEE